jgi:hypothetical protein
MAFENDEKDVSEDGIEPRDLGDMRGLGQGVDVEEAQRDILDRFLGDDAEEAGSAAPSAQFVHLPESQPCNQATMVCLRGPCQFCWQMTTRFGHDIDSQVRIQRHRVCLRHYYETQLADQNVYVCDEWWPRKLAFVPHFMRAMLRPMLRERTEEQLRKDGYDFKWRWFDLDHFEKEGPAERGDSAPGAGRRRDEKEREATSKTGHGASVPKEGQ